MIKYKSHCRQTKTFYGVTFHYGETKLVPGYIHDPRFVCLGNVEIEDKNPETITKTETKDKVENKQNTTLPVKSVTKSENKVQDKKVEEKKKQELKKEEKKPESTKKSDEKNKEEKKIEKSPDLKAEKSEKTKGEKEKTSISEAKKDEKKS